MKADFFTTKEDLAISLEPEMNNKQPDQTKNFQFKYLFSLELFNTTALY